MESRRVIYLVLFTFTLYSTGEGFECYVCSRQDANNEKCLKTIKTCEPGEDMCLTEISWGTMPYWQAGADKQFYISKSCATEAKCKRSVKKTLESCTHIWYEDWKCAECCAGDRCNYYLISGGENVKGGGPALLFSLLIGFHLHTLL